MPPTAAGMDAAADGNAGQPAYGHAPYADGQAVANAAVAEAAPYGQPLAAVST